MSAFDFYRIVKILKVYSIENDIVVASHAKYHIYTLRLMLIILMMPIAVIAVLFMRSMKKIFHIRLRTISTAQIGHFVEDSGILLCESIYCKNKFIDLYWLPKPVSNLYFERMVKRTFFVRWWVKYLYIANLLVPGGEQYTVQSPRIIQGSRDIRGLFYKTRKIKEAYFSFLEDEDTYGRNFLKKLGINKQDKFICLNVRDSAYKKNVDSSRDWSYHNYRDSCIDTYSKVAILLAKKGYWVLRMGRVTANPLSCNHERIFDYSSSDKSNDFLDIWLMANCSFCISTGSGIDSVAEIYRKPLALVNYLPVADMVTYSHAVSYFKHLRWKINNRYLSLRESLQHSYFTTKEYDDNGIDVIDLSDNEIKEAVLELEARLRGVWKDEDIDLQDKFWDIYREWNGFKKTHGFIHPDAKVCSRFLRTFPYWLK